MKRLAWFAGLITIAAVVVPTSSFGQQLESPETHRSFRIVTGKTYGYTKYRITYQDTHYGTPVTAENEMKFPLDTYMAGFEMSFWGDLETGGFWRARFSLKRNAVDPDGAAEDTHWRTFVRLYAEDEVQQWRYTESNAELGAWHFEGEGRLAISPATGLSVEGFVGLIYQRLSFDVYGFEGWILSGETQESISEYLGVNVVDYTVSHLIPYAGIGSAYSGLPPVLVRADVGFSPRAKSDDEDDHILQNRLSEASNLGYAVLGNCSLLLTIGSVTHGRQWFAEAKADYLKLVTKGTQVQRWYEDDPATPPDESQRLVRGIDDEMQSIQYGVSLYFGFSF